MLRQVLFQLQNLQTLKIGYDVRESATLSPPISDFYTRFDTFRFPPNLMNINYHYFDNNGLHFQVEFKRNSEEKIQGKGHIKWLLDPEDPLSIYLDDQKDRYEGEVDRYQMHGKGVLYYLPSNAYKVDRFEGTFIEGEESEGIMYFRNGDRYEGKFECYLKTVSGKIFFHNGDYYEGQVYEFKMHGKGILYKNDGTKCKGIFNQSKLLRRTR